MKDQTAAQKNRKTVSAPVGARAEKPTGAAQTLTVHVPFTFRKRGGRKLILGPQGERCLPPRPRIDSAMIKAVARAYRWRRLIETGVHATIEDLAAAEKINASYVSRVLRLSLLAPDIVETILNGKQAIDLRLDALLKPIPVDWRAQRSRFNAPH